MTREEWLRVKDVTAAVARLKTTTVVNEAYVKLFAQRDVDWQDRRHFFAIAALIDLREPLLSRPRVIVCPRVDNSLNTLGFCSRRVRRALVTWGGSTDCHGGVQEVSHVLYFRVLLEPVS